MAEVEHRAHSVDEGTVRICAAELSAVVTDAALRSRFPIRLPLPRRGSQVCTMVNGPEPGAAESRRRASPVGRLRCARSGVRMYVIDDEHPIAEHGYCEMRSGLQTGRQDGLDL